MTFQGIHFDEVLMTLSQCEGKEEEKSRAKEECLCEAEEREWRAEAKEAFKEESYEKEFNRLKTRKEVRMMYSESILVGRDVR